MRVSRIELANWKNFRTVAVDLPERVFLVGPNASGKSNFLDAFRFLRDLVIAGGFKKACDDLRGGVSRIRCLAARKYPEIRIAVELTEGSRKHWRYEIALTQDNNRNPRLTREIVHRGGKLILSRPDEKDSGDPLRLSQTALEQISESKPFREIAQFFESIAYLHLVPQIIRSPLNSIENGGTLDAYGRHFLERVATTPEKTRNARLRRIRDALTTAVPQLETLKLEKDARGVPHLIGTYSHWRPNAGKQNEQQFSDGTLRLLGLLWSLQEGDGPLLLEEPELLLHTAVVRRLTGLIHRMQRVRKRQVLISTHSVELLSDAGIGGEEVIMLIPDVEGAKALPATGVEEIRALLDTGMTVAEAVLPHTEPGIIAKLDSFEL